jgi:hypothetical protein
MRDFAANIYSQSGEDGMLSEIFNRIGEGARVCIEFGAADGVSCSNTKALRDRGWMALLLESDPALYQRLIDQLHVVEEVNDDVRTQLVAVTPDNIDTILESHGYVDPDLMSIDVDGADWLIFDRMSARPRVVVIEYNRSVPSGYDLRQADEHGSFGASGTALCAIASDRGYALVGVTECNLIFVRNEDIRLFDDLIPPGFDTELTYLVTDFHGNVAVLGDPPWGVAGPYLGDLVGSPHHALPRSLPEMTGTVASLRAAYESIYGRSLFIDAGWHHLGDRASAAMAKLSDLFVLNPPLILIDISFYRPEEIPSMNWIQPDAEAAGYTYNRHGNLLVALLKEAT